MLSQDSGIVPAANATTTNYEVPKNNYKNKTNMVKFDIPDEIKSTNDGNSIDNIKSNGRRANNNIKTKNVVIFDIPNDMTTVSELNASKITETNREFKKN